MDLVSAKRAVELQDDNIRAMAAKEGLSVEEMLFTLMRDTPELFGAMQDWDDVQNVCTAAIRELMPFSSCREIYELVLHVVKLYDTQVITVLRIFSDVRRLAFFVNEMIETMLEVGPYKQAIEAEVAKFSSESDRIAVRGLVLRRITSAEVREILVHDKARFFKAEIKRSVPESDRD